MLTTRLSTESITLLQGLMLASLAALATFFLVFVITVMEN
jgi:hypothetical protein